MDDIMAGIPNEIAEELRRFVEAAKTAWGEHLRSIVLYGSAAEGNLRKTSDVNVLIVLRAFDRARADQVREALRYARAAIRLNVMLLLDSEMVDAAMAFGVKFDDIDARHRILYGDDPFDGFEVPRAAAIARLRQVLLNLRLRLRERYTSLGLREEQIARVAADFAGPLRACAATLCRLEGRPQASPKAALEYIVNGLAEPRFAPMLAAVSEARSDGLLAPGAAGDLLFLMIDLATALHARASTLA